MKVLYSSSDVHSAIKLVFANPKPNERRVVLVAYVGEDAEAFLPFQKDLTLICSLQPGATSARSLKRLMKLGTKVLRAKRLHMKVYWSELSGCVICSANASKNALGKHGLKEAGVLLSAGTVDIDRLIARAKPAIISPTDLRELQRKSDAIHARLGVGVKSKDDAESFLDWIESPGRTEWKLVDKI